MKKKLSILLALCIAMTFTFAGCGAGSSPSGEVKKVAEGFFTALQEGDAEKAESYATEEAVKEGLFYIDIIRTLPDAITEDLGVSKDALSDDAKAKLDEFGKEFAESFVTSYEIGEAKVNEGGTEALASAKVTFGFNPEKAADISLDEKVEAQLFDYMKENESALAEVFEKDGEEAVMAKVINDNLAPVLDAYLNALKETGEKEMSVDIEFENKDDSGWKISGFTEAAE